MCVSTFWAIAFAQTNHAVAKTQWRNVADQMRGKLPQLSRGMDDTEEDVLTYMTLPQQHRTKLHSTNPIERINGEITSRTDVVENFQNEAAIRQLVGATLMDRAEKLAAGRAIHNAGNFGSCLRGLHYQPTCNSDRLIRSPRRKCATRRELHDAIEHDLGAGGTCEGTGCAPSMLPCACFLPLQKNDPVRIGATHPIGDIIDVR